ncbi:MAG TPA: hypothetical protein VLC09_07960 [Polyangiaceae bacterium]|nr:hypothetical protein [Polyangiaceae bacterium]
MKRTMKQKAEAALGLLLGMRLPEVIGALEPHGFGPHVVSEGFESLRRLATARGPAPTPVERLPNLSQVEELQSWFLVARRVLGRRHPEVAVALLSNLRRRRGIQVHPLLRVFFERLDRLEAGDPIYGPRASEARAALAARGLDARERARCRRLLDDALAMRPPRSPDAAQSEREREALDELWRWYLEWSAIARLAVVSPNARRALGLERSEAPRRLAYRRTPFVLQPPA